MVWLAAGCPGMNQWPTEPSVSLGESRFGSCCRGIERAIPVSVRFYYTKKRHKGARYSGQLSSGSWGCLLCPRGDANRVLAAAEPPARTRLPGAEHHGPWRWAAAALFRGGPRATATCCGPGKVSPSPEVFTPGETEAAGSAPKRSSPVLPRAPGKLESFCCAQVCSVEAAVPSGEEQRTLRACPCAPLLSWGPGARRAFPPRRDACAVGAASGK